MIIDSSFITVIIGISFALFTILCFLTKKPFTVINLIVILFMTALITPMLAKLLPMLHLYPSSHGFELFRATPFTFGPFLYLYTKGETGLLKKFSFNDSFHFIPFIAITIIMIISGNPEKGMPPGFHERPPEFSENGPPFDLPEPPRFNEAPPEMEFEKLHEAENIFRFVPVLIYLSLTVYTIMVIILIQKHNRNIDNIYSSDTININLKWIKWITLCFLLSYFVVIAEGIFNLRNDLNHPPFHTPVPDLATAFFIFMFSFFSLKQPLIYTDKESSDPSNISDTKTEKRYEKSGLKEEAAENYFRQIIEFMAMEKPYTDPDLTINSLSEKTGIPRHYLTQIINEMLNKNFFTFVNEYRIIEVKEKLLQEKYSEYSILRIAYESGFNSKSTFNCIFKKLTGITPTQYRKTVTLKNIPE